MTDHEHPERRSGAERRVANRVRADDIPGLRARLLAGREVDVVDVSESGARFRSDQRLLPGSNVGLKLVSGDVVFTAVARVVRSTVSHVATTGVVYESAVSFDKRFPLLEQTMSPETVSSSAPQEGAGQGPNLAAVPAEPDEVLTFTAFVPESGPDIKEIFEANRW